MKLNHEEIIRLNQSGLGYKKLAKMFQVSKSAIYWIMLKNKDIVKYREMNNKAKRNKVEVIENLLPRGL